MTNTPNTSDKKLNLSQIVWEITSQLQEADSLEEALRSSLSEVVRFLNAEAGTIWFYNKDGDGKIYPSYWIGGADLTGLSLQPGEGIAGTVIETGIMTIVKDCKNDPRWAGRFDQTTGFDTQSMICVPLINKYEVIGCIQIINKKDGSLYTDEDVSLCETLAQLTAIAIDSRGLNLGFVEKKPVILSLRNITKTFGEGEAQVHALRNLNLDIHEGEFLVILGKSGCGKSTLLNIIGGMSHATSGTFYFDGKDYTHASDKELTEYRRHCLGFIFQAYNLIPTLTVKDNLEFTRALSNNPLSVDAALSRVDLASRSSHYPTQLSGGQQQRVSIACALAKRPRIILADEPTAALDYATSIDVLSALEDVVKQGGTLLMVSHNEEIAKMANRVIRMHDGAVSEITINKHPALASELVW